MKFPKVNPLQRFALLAVLLSLVVLGLGLSKAYTVYHDNLLILNVHVVGLHTYHQLDKNGIHLVYGTTGQIFYHTKSYFDTLKFDHFEQNIANHIIMLVLAVTVLIVSLKKNQVFFSENTIWKFYGVLGLFMVLTAGKFLLMMWIRNDFYNTTGRIFKLELADEGLANSWQILTMLFMFTVIGIVGAGIKQFNSTPAEV